MSDLNSLLMEAAGRSSAAASSSRKSRPPPPSSSSSSASSSPRNLPLKKRFPNSNSDSDNNNSDSDSAPSVGSDLYKGDSDKEQLDRLPELQREMILAERSTKIDDYKLRKKAQAHQPKNTKSTPVQSHSHSRTRNSSRFDGNNKKADALNVLRAKRMKQVGENVDNVRKRPAAAPADSESEDDGKKSSDEDEFMMKGDDVDDDKVSFEDVKGITIRRSRLAKWLLEPFFEEVVQGCFVRLGVGKSRSGLSVYKLCLVKNVDSTDKGSRYKLEGRNTVKYLNLVWGAESTAARWPMTVVSDSPPEEDEFKSWLQAVESTNGRMPTKDDILDKKEAINKINTFVYSAASVKQMLQVKKSASTRPLNHAAEKDRLRKEMEVAENNKNEAEMERIRDRLKELDAIYQQTKEKNLKAVRLSEMNKRNKAENFKNASELKPVNTSLKAGEAGYDPFSRRWTRSTNYYVSKTAEANALEAEGNAEGAGVGSGEPNELGVAATAAALEAAEGAGKLVDTRAPGDHDTELNSVHNFELSISLAGLQKYGGAAGAVAGYLARKAKIEATIGYKVPENDGKRHAVTLTISDYKRRMGLI